MKITVLGRSEFRSDEALSAKHGFGRRPKTNKYFEPSPAILAFTLSNIIANHLQTSKHITSKRSPHMDNSDCSGPASQDSSLQHGWTQQQQQDFCFFAERTTNHANSVAADLNAWNQSMDYNNLKPDSSLASSLAGSAFLPHLPSPYRPPDATLCYAGYFAAQPIACPQSQSTASHSSSSQSSSDSSDLFLPPVAPIPPSRDSRTGLIVKTEHPSTFETQHDTSSSSPIEIAEFSSQRQEQRATSSSRSKAQHGSSRVAVTETDLLKKVYDTTQCFWLVSENRMTVMQEELKVIKTRIDESGSELDSISSQVSQVLPLQIEITQKVVGAAEERRIIFARLKSLEESASMWQQEFKASLEAMRADFRAGMELMLELAPKARKPQIQKSMEDTVVSKGNKRPSTPSKKATAPKAKKGKTQEVIDVEEEVPKTPVLSPSSSSPPVKPEPCLSSDWTESQPRSNPMPIQNRVAEQPKLQDQVQHYWKDLTQLCSKQVRGGDHQRLPHGRQQQQARAQSVTPQQAFRSSTQSHSRVESAASHLTSDVPKGRLHTTASGPREIQPQPFPPSNAPQQAPIEPSRPHHHPQPIKSPIHDIQQGLGSLEVAFRG